MPFFSKEKEEISLLIDIGNGSISGVFVSFAKGKKPSFLYNLRLPFNVTEKPESSRLVEDMNSLLDSILSSIMKEAFKKQFWKRGNKRISRVMITFSSPWFALKTKNINLVKESSFVITKNLIDDISKKEEELFKKELGIEIPEQSKDSFVIIEKSIVHTKINGYILENSIGKKTKVLDAFLCMSVISQNIVNNINNLILRYTHVPKEKVTMHTFPLVSFSVIRDVFHNSSDFMLMDVTGEVTDLTLVKDDVIVQTVSFPSGRNFVIRQIASVFNVSSAIAASTLNLYNLKKLDEPSVLRLEEIIVNIEKEWSIYLENALLELSPSMTLPGLLYLTTDDDVAEIFKSFLKLSKTDATSTFRNNANIIRIDATTLSKFYQNDYSLKIDEFVAILAIFYNKIIQSS